MRGRRPTSTCAGASHYSLLPLATRRPPRPGFRSSDIALERSSAAIVTTFSLRNARCLGVAKSTNVSAATARDGDPDTDGATTTGPQGDDDDETVEEEIWDLLPRFTPERQDRYSVLSHDDKPFTLTLLLDHNERKMTELASYAKQLDLAEIYFFGFSARKYQGKVMTAEAILGEEEDRLDLYHLYQRLNKHVDQVDDLRWKLRNILWSAGFWKMAKMCLIPGKSYRSRVHVAAYWTVASCAWAAFVYDRTNNRGAECTAEGYHKNKARTH